MERKKRSTLFKQAINLDKPLNLSIIGTQDDPCFGKHYDSQASECGRCGDAEFCLIATAHKLNAKRLNIERKEPFKDLEEKPKEKKEPFQEEKRILINRLKSNDNKYPYTKAIRLFKNRFSYEKAQAKEILETIISKSKRLTIENNYIIYEPKS